MDGVNKKCFVCRREAKSMKVLLSSRFVCEECLTVMNKNETLCCLDCDAVRKIPPDNTERELSCLCEGVNTSNSTDRPCLQEGIRDRCRFDVTAQIKDRRETRHDHRRYYSGKHVASEPNLSYLFHPGNVGNSSLKTKIQDLTGQVKKPTGVCEKHDMEETKFYCQTCKMDICRDCALLDHRDHDYVYYSERGDTKDSLHERLSKLLKYAEEKQAVLNEKLEYLDSRLEKKSKEVEEAKMEIRSRTSRLKALISEQEEILLSCLEGHIKSVSRNVKSQKTALESALDDVNYGLEIAQEMFRNNSSKMPRKLPNGLTKNHAAPDQNETGPVRTNDGKCSAVTIVADDHENCHDKVSRRQFESEGDFCDDKFDADDLYIVEKEKLDSSISSGCPWNSDMKQPNNALIIAEDNIKEPLPKNSTFDFVLSFGDQGSHSGEFEEPVGVTVSPDGTIFIADYTNDRLQLYDRNGHFLRAMSQVTTETGRKVPFLCPTGLATDKSGNIVIAERGRHRITVVAPDGRLQHKLGRLGKAQGQLRDPHGVSVDKRGRIIVSDTTNNRIQVFDKDGDVIFAFGNKGEHVLDYPNYAIFHKGVFIVSDTDNDCVKIFDKKGQFLRTLGVTENEEGSFSAPSGLAVYKEDYILVCDFNNDCVKMFSLEGVFVTKIGCEGTGPGEFSGPEAVTVTSDDKIIVTDKNNSRVQVFELRQ